MLQVTLREKSELAVMVDDRAFRLRFSPGPMRLSELAAKALEIGAFLTGLQEEKSAAAGRPVSCKQGCAACCREAIPLSPAEAFHVADLAEALPAEDRHALALRFHEAFHRAQSAFPHTSFFEDTGAYFKLAIACPFLAGESCSIHASRPAACREHLALSPADQCWNFPNLLIEPLEMGFSIRDLLIDLSAEILGRGRERIPLTASLLWAEEHAADRARTWDAGYLAELLCRRLRADIF